MQRENLSLQSQETPPRLPLSLLAPVASAEWRPRQRSERQRPSELAPAAEQPEQIWRQCTRAPCSCRPLELQHTAAPLLRRTPSERAPTPLPPPSALQTEARMPLWCGACKCPSQPREPQIVQIAQLQSLQKTRSCSFPCNRRVTAGFCSSSATSPTSAAAV
jgi:hypothetical protein